MSIPSGSGSNGVFSITTSDLETKRGLQASSGRDYITKGQPAVGNKQAVCTKSRHEARYASRTVPIYGENHTYHYQFIRLFLGSLLVPDQDTLHHLHIQRRLAICEHLACLAQGVQSSFSLTVCLLTHPILLQQHQAVIVQG